MEGHVQGRTLDYERTRIASERTLMAWVRTSVSLIGFGFSIPTLIGVLANATSRTAAPGISPKALGLVLVALGTFGLCGGIVEHLRLLARVTPNGSRRDKLSATLFTAATMGLVGMVAFLYLLSS